MQIALEERGIKYSKSTIRRAMRVGGYLHKRRKPNGLTKATTETQEKENLIKRNFTANKLMKKLLTDISEIRCMDGKLYISPILDCCNGEIVALEICIYLLQQDTDMYK